MDISEETVDFLAHYGVKGMHWGIRRDRESGVSRKTDRQAQKDAKEFARAKMFYGEGAGTRRKLIKATVDARSKDPGYKSAFDRHYANQDLGSHAQKARGERSRTDKKKSVRQGAGYVARRLTGEMGTVAAFTALSIGGYVWLNTPRGRRFMNDHLGTDLQGAAARVQDAVKRRGNARNIRRVMNG